MKSFHSQGLRLSSALRRGTQVATRNGRFILRGRKAASINAAALAVSAPLTQIQVVVITVAVIVKILA
jgi:hypothetical protein